MSGLPSGMVTFLFTDLEGSTRLWEEHPDAMRDALARHDAILRKSIETHDGYVVKSTGDGVYAVFTEAIAAVVAATDAVRAFLSEVWGSTGPLRARIGIHTGTAEERDGDYFGPALNRASRLMGAAHGGQVVLSHVSAGLVRDALPDGLTLLDLGEHRLRGITRPERVYELAITGVPSEFPPLQSLDAFPGDLVLPGPSYGRGDELLAGRETELDRLASAWDQARSGVRQIVLMGGEPGVGKTRLSNELSRRVYAQRGAVLYGRCDEEAIVPYQPFVEALRPCINAYAPSALRERLHGLEPDLARVFPELLARLPEPTLVRSGDAEAERYRFFEAITTLLTGVTASQPTLLVLDDLHWADKPTLLLLRHLIRYAPRAPLFILACYRNIDLEPDDAFSDLLADLRRVPDVARLTLAGLSEEESGELLRGLAGREVARPLVMALHRETDGNPFFLEELLQHLMETDGLSRIESGGARPIDFGELDLPDGVREVVARRLRRLPDTVNDVLALAAVIGRDFDVGLLARAAEQPIALVLEALDQATDAGIVQQDVVRMNRYTFSHALIRQTLNVVRGTARRAQLHARTGAAMEESKGSPYAAAELALHFTHAAPLVGARKAIEHTTQAGRDALADLAFEDAAAHFERALHLADQYEPDDTSSRVELLTDLASALVYVDERAGVETALRAVDAARDDGSAAQFGRAVAVFVEPVYGVLGFPAEITRVFDEARVVLGESDPALRARLLAFEAFKYATNQLHGRDARALAREAAALARSSGDPVTLADALFALAVSLDAPAHLAERVALADELVNLGEQASASARAPAFGLRLLAGTHLELGDAAAFTSTIIELARIGDERRWLPAHVYAAQWRVTQALLEGRFDDVRACEQELRGLARAYRGAAGMYRIQTFHLLREEGRLPLGAMGQRAEVDVDVLYAWALLSLALLESGSEQAAFANLDKLAAKDFHSGESEGARGPALAMLAEVAASCDSQPHAAALYDQLLPYAGRIATEATGLPCVGAADRFLGMLSTVLERWEAADAHFAQALSLEEGIRGHALLPRTRYWQARFLRARGRAGDERAARALLTDVVEESSRLGMNRLGAQAEELRAQ
jgi:class 3 adenylate cyclase